MFGKRIDLFRLFGFDIRLDLSWVLLLILVAWSLSAGLFPFRYQGLPAHTYWLMGIVAALGLSASILFHELAHSIVARRFGLPMKGITLFLFGGMAEMKKEPPNPKTEFAMAIAGPVSSAVLALAFYALYRMGSGTGWPEAVYGILKYLSWINAILAVFNLVPAFPLDGGRILRSALWAWKGNLRWSTRVASEMGAGFGFALIVLGALQFLRGHFIGGMWWIFIGMLVRGAAKTSYQQLLVRKALEGEPIQRFMKTEPVTVSPTATVEQLVEDYIYRHQHKLFPVVEEPNRLLGCVTIKQVKEVPRQEWASKRVRDLVQSCSAHNTLSVRADALEALTVMKQTGSSRLMVTEGDRLIGIITLKDLLAFFGLKIDLEPF